MRGAGLADAGARPRTSRAPASQAGALRLPPRGRVPPGVGGGSPWRKAQGGGRPAATARRARGGGVIMIIMMIDLVFLFFVRASES